MLVAAEVLASWGPSQGTCLGEGRQKNRTLSCSSPAAPVWDHHLWEVSWSAWVSSTPHLCLLSHCSPLWCCWEGHEADRKAAWLIKFLALHYCRLLKGNIFKRGQLPFRHRNKLVAYSGELSMSRTECFWKSGFNCGSWEFQNLALDPNSSFGIDVFIHFSHYFHAGHLLFVLQSAVKEMATCPYLELVLLPGGLGRYHTYTCCNTPSLLIFCSIMFNLPSAAAKFFELSFSSLHLLLFIFSETCGQPVQSLHQCAWVVLAH